MLRPLTIFALLVLSAQSFSQKSDKLTVEKIMRDPKWIGTSPSNVQWSPDGQFLYFNWNPTNDIADSLYYITLGNKVPTKANTQETQNFNTSGNFLYNVARTAYVYAKDGDVFYVDVKKNTTKRITQTTETEAVPRFSFNETKVVYSRSQNLYAWDINSGETLQLTNLRASEAAATTPAQGGAGFQRVGGTGGNRGQGGGSSNVNPQEDWLKTDQLQWFQILKERKEEK